jgi:hypothetical protein
VQLGARGLCTHAEQLEHVPRHTQLPLQKVSLLTMCVVTLPLIIMVRGAANACVLGALCSGGGCVIGVRDCTYAEQLEHVPRDPQLSL